MRITLTVRAETEKVLALTKDLSASGLSVLFVGHNLERVLATADRVDDRGLEPEVDRWTG